MFPQNLLKEFLPIWLPVTNTESVAQKHSFSQKVQLQIAHAACRLYSSKLERFKSIQSRLLHLTHIYDATNSNYGALLHCINIPICFFCGFMDDDCLKIDSPRFKVLLISTVYFHAHTFVFETYSCVSQSYEPIFFEENKQKWVPLIWKFASTKKSICMICKSCYLILKQYQRSSAVRFKHQGDFLYRLSDPMFQSFQNFLEKHLPIDLASLVEDYRLDFECEIDWSCVE